MSLKKPGKKTDKELWSLISEIIDKCDYVFLKHAKKRLADRKISDITVLDILENKPGSKRKRNKAKDEYTPGKTEWKYCLEGIDPDGSKIRIIITFDDPLLLVITVIRLEA